jgi:hypothetical protein
LRRLDRFPGLRKFPFRFSISFHLTGEQTTMKPMRILAFVACVLATIGAMAQTQNTPAAVSTRGSNLSFVAGRFVANEYVNYGGNFASQVYQGNSATGSSTITVRGGYIVLQDGRSIVPFAVGVPIVLNDTTAELVTPTAVSGCYKSQGMNQDAILVTCTITASFSFTHGIGTGISSGTGGLAEAVNDAFNWGGGLVEIQPGFSVNTTCTGCYASVNAAIAAILPYASVGIEDCRTAPCQPWQPAQQVATVLAAPTTLTSTTVGFGINGANTTGGTYTGTSTYNVNIAYVDVMGNEGPASATFSGLTAGTGSTNQIGIAAPAASTGAVGVVAYISLASGTYNLSYQVPMTAATCPGGLTKIETVTPACAVTNATYGQTGGNIVVSALTVNTAPLHLLKTTASTTAAYIGTPSGRTSYAYVPTGVLDGSGLTSTQQAYTVATAAATTVPEVIATIPISIGRMNFPGATLCVEGQATEASAGSTATVQNIEALWDAAGSDTAGAPIIIGQLQLTATLVTANADNWSFHECFQTTASGATTTSGSIQPFGGQLISTYGAGVLGNAGTEVNVAPIGSLNLAGTGGNTQRLHLVWLHTTGTDGAGVQVTALRSWWQ